MPGGHVPSKRGKRFGFTLIEIVVALMVISVATAILVSLFGSSLELARANRNLRVATQLAEDRLALLRQDAAHYAWPDWNQQKAGEQAEITPKQDSGVAHGVDLPSELPLDEAASGRENDFYAGFSWQAYATLPAPDAAYIELTVVVRWQELGQERHIALSSCAPQTHGEGAA